MSLNDFMAVSPVQIDLNGVTTKALIRENYSSEEYARLYNRHNYSLKLEVVRLRNEAVAYPDKASIVVEKPGFYYRWQVFENIGYFDTILFTEPGRFSLLSIYKQLRETKPIFNTVDEYGNYSSQVFFNTLRMGRGGNYANWYRTFYNSVLNSTVPFPAISLDDVQKTDVFKTICADTFKVFDGEILEFKVSLNETDDLYQDYVLFQDKYLPVILTSHNEIFLLKKNSLEKVVCLPTYKDKVDQSYFWSAFSAAHSTLRARYPNFNRAANYSPICLSCFDIKQKKLVMSPSVMTEMHEFLLQNFDQFFSEQQFPNLEKFETLIKTLKPTNTFKDDINKYIESRGFTSLKVTAVYPGIFKGYTTRYGFSDHISKQEETEDLGYYIDVSYKGDPYLGPTVRNNPGWVFIRPDFTLVHSTWCQHITRWSQDIGRVTDQEYKVWNIVDWLTGPYAEKIDAKIVEAPFVFMGRFSGKAKLVKEKAKILQQMKDSLSKMELEKPV